MPIIFTRTHLRLRRANPGFSHWIAAVAFFAAGSGAVSITYAQDPARLVKDINPTRILLSSNPDHFVALGRRTFFAASTHESGRELWVTDGSEAGTHVVFKVEPGPEGPGVDSLVSVGNRLYFTEHHAGGDPDTSLFETNLWKSDGTASGTVAILHTPGIQPRTEKGLVVAGKRVFFSVLDSPPTGSRMTVWASDGSAAGTRPMIVFPVASGETDPEITALGDVVLFVVSTAEGTYELWRSDGTISGTALLMSFSLGNCATHTKLARAGDWIYFVAADPAGCALWKTDGTASGTMAVRGDFDASRSPEHLTEFGDALVFTAADTAEQIFGIWRSDGSQQGTVLVTPTGAETSNLTAAGDRLYFVVRGTQLWTSNGAAGSADLVIESDPWPSPNLSAFDDRLLFTLPDGAAPTALWVTNGTPQGTLPLNDINPAADSHVHFGPNQLPFFFSADDGATGGELWTTDGTSTGTYLVRNIAAEDETTPPSYVSNLTRLGNVAYFAASDGTKPNNAAELWKTDGTWIGTVKITDINSTSSPWSLGGLTVVGESRFFFALGSALWTSDGTQAGTVALTRQGQSMYPSIWGLTAVGDVLFYISYDSPYRQVCRSDGTASGTRCLDNSGVNFPLRDPIAVGDKLFYVGGWGGLNEDLFAVTDGEHPHLVRAIKPGRLTTGSKPHSLTALGDTLLFFAEDGVHGFELWRSDGTEEGTVLVADINPGSSSSAPNNERTAELHGRVYFAADDGIHGPELWRSDGTVAGTELVEDVIPGPQGSYAAPVRAGEHIFFFAADGPRNEGLALRVYDESRGRSVRLRAVTPPTGFITTAEFADVAGLLIFASCDDAHGCEPWASDGTAAGTNRLADIAVGSATSNPAYLTPFGSQLLLAADDGIRGRELWAIRLSDSAACPGDCSGDGRVSIDELVTAVAVALGTHPLGACNTLDDNGDGSVGIDELVTAVNSALSGC